VHVLSPEPAVLVRQKAALGNLLLLRAKCKSKISKNGEESVVNLLEPGHTPYDLRWRLFGVHVRVHPMFWLLSAILGFNTTEFGFQYLLFWMACVFVSILIHEFGHVWMGLAFGAEGHIVLYGFGGLAIGSNRSANPWKRIAVALAGPMAGFLF